MNKLSKLLMSARKGGYAIPAFNYADIWEIEAIIEAAEEARAPIMLASIPRVVDAHSLDICAAMVSAAAKNATVPIIHHLDHSVSVEMCKNAVLAGYDSVMYDGSKLPLEENIENTKIVVDFAHKHNVLVEAEIGQIMGRGYEGTFEGGEYLAEVEDAVALAQSSGVDLLAVGIGTAHGFYQGEPKISFNRLEEIQKEVSIHLVLHGATGISTDDVQKTIALGIDKVNVGTAIWHAHVLGIAQRIEEKGVVHTLDINLNSKDKIKEVARNTINTCMANNRA